MPRAPADWLGIVRRNRRTARRGDTQGLDGLLSAFRWRYDTARNEAVRAVVSLGPQVFPALLRLARTGSTAVERRAAVDALGLLGEPEAVPQVVRALRDPNMVVRRAALIALVRLRASKEIPRIVRLLQDESGGVRVLAAEVLGRFQDRRAVPALVRSLRDPKWYVRQAAARALGAIGDARAVPALERAAQDPRRAVAYVAALALRSLGRGRGRSSCCIDAIHGRARPGGNNSKGSSQRI